MRDASGEAGTVPSRGEGHGAPSAATVEPTAVGEVVAGYRLDALAGSGGMGVVYRATDAELGRTVALKLIAPERAGDPALRELFVRESLTAARLEHPNVIPIHRAGDDDGRLFIAMRFVEGASLQELISASPGGVPPGRAARIVARVADALDAAHARGLVHRDVKPANVLIADPDGEEHVYLTDFGLSVPNRPGAAAAPGGWAGTLAYLAPEQIDGGPLDARTDVYALGCVLFHALTGRPPFGGGDEDAVLQAHRSQQPPAPSSVVTGLPPAMDAVVRRAMAKRPEDRFASAGELGRAALSARYDVALLVDAADRDAAGTIAGGLGEAGLHPLVVADGGRGAAEGVRASGACAVVVGREGLGDWARSGLAAARELAVRDRAFRLVLVLLPGAPDPADPTLAYLATHPWVDLRAGVADALATGDLARALRGADVPAGLPTESGECPYRGLEAFREEDAPLYFGREQDTALLIEGLRTTRFVGVLGPSGSGKSSLVRAGLLPAVRRGAIPGGEAWRVVEVVPGEHPLGALAAGLGQLPGAGAPSPADLAADERALDLAVARALSDRPEGERVMVLVDQLEEAFTLCADAGERAAFLGNLVYAATIPGGRVVVVAAMRADFYHRLAEHPELRALVSTHQHLVGPMDARALRRAIEGPARHAGLELEPGLTRRILTDVADRPGTLPLLEHLLVELWKRRRDRTLTLEAYAASGGVEGALARRANEVYGTMPAERQAIARRILLRLTQPGEGTEDTRRRALRSELVTRPEEQAAVDGVIDALAEARLVTTARDDVTGESVVEVTHEALLRGWPELRGWIDEDRDRLRAERRLSDAAVEWDRGGREDGALYRGARLLTWQERDRSALNPAEMEFLAAGDALAERERETRRRRARIALGALGAVAVVVAGLAIFAFIQRGNAADERDLAQSRQLATESETQLATDPELAALLAAAAYDADHSPEAEAALRQAVHESKVRSSLNLAGQVPLTVVASGDGRVVVGTDGGALRAWDPTADPRGSASEPLGVYAGGVNMVVGTRDGYLTGGNDGAIVAWPRAAGGGGPREVARSKGSVYRLRVSPDGRRVVTSGDGGVFEHDLTTGATRTIAAGLYFDVAFDALSGGVFTTAPDGRLLRWRAGAREGTPISIPGTAQVMGTSADGRRLGVGTGQGLAVLALGEQPRVLFSAAFQGGANGVSFGPGGLVAAACGDGSVRVFDSAGGLQSRMTGHKGPVADVTFLGRDRVVSTGVDGGTRAWAWAAGREPRLESGPMPAVGGVTFVNQETVDVVGADGSARAWTPPARTARTLLPADPGGASPAAVSRDGALVATTSPDGMLVARNARGRRIGEWPLGQIANDLAWAPDGRSLAAALGGGDVSTVEVGSPAPPRVIGTHAEDATTVAARPGDGTIASGGRDGTIRLWDGTRAGRLVADLDSQVNALAFSPDGRWLAAAVGDETTRVYDLAGADDPVVLRGRFGVSYSLAFSDDGADIATGSDSGLRIWDWRRGVILLTTPRADGIRDLTATGAAPRVASYGFDDVVRVTTCDVCGPIDQVQALVSQRTTRALTDEERTDFQVDG